MTTPIKFRGFRVDNGKVIYGDLIQDKSGNKWIISIEQFSLSNMLQIHPSSLGMFTGRTDKNGKEIYGAIGDKGGDVIKDFQGNVFTCIFDGLSFDMKDSKGNSRSSYYHTERVFWLSHDEIIGNQWEVDNGK